MTKRDLFLAHAINGVLPKYGNSVNAQNLANMAITFVDALIELDEKKKGQNAKKEKSKKK